MTYLTELKKRLRDAASGKRDMTPIASWHALDAITKLEKNVELLEVAHAQMQKAHDSLTERASRLEDAIMDRLHWVVLDGSHCNCGECQTLIAALKGEAKP